jgi:NAD-dependent SIR2 family protein deacetylase
MEIQEQDIESLISVVADRQSNPILFLGAGASIKSGIPGTGAFVERAAAWVYARKNQLDYDDVRIRRSDWMPFLEKNSWFDQSKSLPENYPNVFKKLLIPRELRREFFRTILNPKVDPSTGYSALKELVVNRYFTTILTTNFDNILYNVFSSDSRIHTVDIIKNVSDYPKISTAPKNIQVIHLHGDVDNYTDKNDIDEIESLNESFIRKLVPLLSDHPLIVVGYRGYENSIMKTLFLNNVNETTHYKHGIYWCILENDKEDELPDNLKDLNSVIGTNLQFVRIKNFDDLFKSKILKGIKPSYKITNITDNGNPEKIFDLKPVEKATIQSFDQILLKQRINQYCKTLKIDIPANLSQSVLEDLLLDRDILINIQDILYPTNSGILLFGKNPLEFIPHSSIKVIIQDQNNFFKNNFLDENEILEKEQIVTGNLWQQLNTIIDIISQFNKQFKLKSEQTKTVTPYPPLAIKELITNCIVHRNYEDSKETLIEINPKFIKIVNSGGLVQDIQHKLEGEELEDVIKKGTKGIKGYRNPVLADLFYGTETMEKKGSGLADVYEEIINYASHVKFGPIENNRFFEAIIYARPELIDEITNTAKEKLEYLQKFSSNIIEIVSLPKFIYTAECITPLIEILEGFSFKIPPAFVLHNKKLITFFDPSNSSTGLTQFIDLGTVEKHFREEIFFDYESEKLLVQLLNLSIVVHLQNKGLHVDSIKKRAYFERAVKDENNVQIKYQARIKSATRTVVKKRISQNNIILYWEHKSISFKVERYENSYGLLIIPNYTFTKDGYSEYIKADKINILSTKRASRDYNIQYLNDLSFWIWIITGGSPNTTLKMFSNNNSEELAFDEQVVISNEYSKATVLSSEIFDDIKDDSFDEIEPFDDIDIIAVINEEDEQENDRKTELNGN